MHKCFLTSAILFCLISMSLFAGQRPRDLSLKDSLFRIKPSETLVQKAAIYLELASLINSETPEKAFSYVLSAFRISILEQNDSLKAKARMLMGDYHSIKRRYMIAHEHYLASWESCRKIQDTSAQIKALAKISSINRMLENYKTALVYLQKGLAMAQKSSDKLTNGLLFDQLGLTYQSMRCHIASFYFFNRALILFRQAGDKKLEYETLNNIGTYYLIEGKNDEGLAYFKKLLEDTDPSFSLIIGSLMTRIGHVYYLKKEYRTSLQYNFKALEIRTKNDAFPQINSSLINIAGDYFKLGKPDSAIIYMDSGLNLASRFDRKNLVENGYLHLSNYYQSQGNFKQALDSYSRYTKLHDEIILERNRSNMAILEAYQQLDRIQQSGKRMVMNKDIHFLNLKYQNYQSSVLRIMIGLAGFSMVVIIFLFLYIRRDRRKMQSLHFQLSNEISEREELEMHTRDNESQYKFITDNSDDFITHMDQDKNRIYASPASLKVYGYEPDEIIAKSFTDLIHPDYHAFTEEKFSEMAKTRQPTQFIYQAKKKDGTFFWVESTLNPLFDPISGDFKGAVGVIRDIQERKTKELEIMEGTKQKENLLKEIHHRVKNNFAILVSLINMQLAQTKNPELLQSLTNLQLRIRTMALVHEMLYRSDDFEKISFPGYLRSLASVIAGTYNRREIHLTIEAEEVVMDIEAAIPIGLIVNEILSNAYKHGFPDGRTGQISVSFSIDRENGSYHLVLQDDGIGMPDGMRIDQFKTMGLQVVQILCTQIEATLFMVNNPGASFSITFKG